MIEVMEMPPGINLKRETRQTFGCKQWVHQWYEKDGVIGFAKFRSFIHRTREETATSQYLADELKKYFGLQELGAFPIRDPKEGMGIMLQWHDDCRTLDQLGFPESESWWEGYGWLEVLKILFFDGILGNRDRSEKNILVLKDQTILPIDEETIFYNSLQIPWLCLKKEWRKRVKEQHYKRPERFWDYVHRVSKSQTDMVNLAADVIGDRKHKFFLQFQCHARGLECMADLTLRQLSVEA